MKRRTKARSGGKLPSKLKIGHLNYTVRRVKDLRSDKDNRILGQHRGLDQKILLLDGLLPEREIEVLLHEVLHALFDHYSLPAKDEEKYITCLGVGLTQVLLDNPDLRRFLND